MKMGQQKNNIHKLDFANIFCMFYSILMSKMWLTISISDLIGLQIEKAMQQFSKIMIYINNIIKKQSTKEHLNHIPKTK